MKRSDPDELTRQLRSIGRSTTPQELQERGVRRVRSVSFRQLTELVRRAVDQALLEHSAELDDPALERLRAAARARTVQRLDQTLEVKDQWRRLAEARSELEERLGEETAPGPGVQTRRGQALGRVLGDLEQGFRRRMSEGMAQLRTAAPGSPAVVERWIEDALGLLRESHRRVVDTVQQDKNERIELLERRIHKLLRNLDQTEQALERVLEGGDEDEGVPSIYREFQGLKARDPNHGRKKELLREVFLANMNLAGPGA